MKTSIIAFSAASVLLISLIIIGTFKTGIVSALTATTTDATSTASDTTTASTSSASASSTPPARRMQAQHPLLRPPKPKRRLKVRRNPNPATASPHSNSSTSSARNTSTTSPTARRRTLSPATRTLIATSISPTPQSPLTAGLTWVSTSGMEAYDTPSGDLEVGDYAQEADGSYISNVPAYTYTDATSSVPIAAHIATSKTDPTAATQ